MDEERDRLEAAKAAQEDFYALLGVEFEASETAIKRAYRMSSLKYHPDKHPGNLEIVEKFHLLGVARDVLLDPKAKAAYDAVRLRRKEKELQDNLLNGRRRAMKDDLERREGAFKRKREDDLSAEQKLEQEIQRLAEDGKRRRREREEQLNKEQDDTEISFAEDSPAPDAVPKPPVPGQVAELDRTIRVRWMREGEQATWDKEKISTLFAKFGNIESVVLAKDKKIRVAGEKHRKAIAMVFIIFSSIVAAHAAVSDGKEMVPALESVTWASKEPDIKSPTAESPSAPSTPMSTPNKSFRASFTGGLGRGPNGLGGTPTFSFSPQSSPSLQDVTMMRLKQAEKKRLEEQIRMKEAAEEGQGV